MTIGDNEILNSNTTTSEELLDEGIGTYTSNLIYIGQMLKCEVIHEGYQKHQLQDENNLAEAQLNLSFKPDRDADITYDLTTSKKSKNMVKVMFRANPKPTSGIWQKRLIIQSIDLSKTLTILMLQKRKKLRVREN